MKRFLPLALTCLLAACSSQHRVDPEPEFSNPDVAPDENPDEPRLGEIESLISQAKLEIKRRDYDEARVKLHQVFRRDRWHPEANTIYQDLQVSRGKGDALYQEYLDLYEKNKTRGDALWFHLRPLLIKRGIKACEMEKRVLPPADALEHIKEIEMREVDSGDDERTRIRKEREAIEEILLLNSMRGDWVARLAYLYPEQTAKKYRELAEENPTSGDSQYLYAMALWGSSRKSGISDDPIEVLRTAWILELPGIYLRLGMAFLCERQVEESNSKKATNKDDARSRLGYENVALNFVKIVLATDASASDAISVHASVQQHARKNGDMIEDLSLKK